jgi:hypothetical protein
MKNLLNKSPDPKDVAKAIASLIPSKSAEASKEQLITAHELARILLDGPDLPVIVNGGDHIEETKALTLSDVKTESNENGNSSGGPFSPNKWVSLGTL